MNRDAILALEGRELDAKIAEVVFGWQWWTALETNNSTLMHPEAYVMLKETEKVRRGRLGDTALISCFDYSSTWGGMGLVVAEMKKRGYVRLALDSGLGPDWELWRAEFLNPDTDTEAYGETAPLATARAALLTLREEE